MAKWYAVKKGMVPGVYQTWEECKSNTQGYPGAIYKSFPSKAEAEEFAGVVKSGDEKKASVTLEKTSVLRAYVDGSFNTKTQMYAYGMVILMPDCDRVIKMADYGRNPEAASMRNVAGEILAAEQAMLFAVCNGYETLAIYHDYEGIAKWCTGEWAARNPFTQHYVEKYQQYAKKVKIKFMKVKGHSGDEYNDMADELAKSQIF